MKVYKVNTILGIEPMKPESDGLGAVILEHNGYIYIYECAGVAWHRNSRLSDIPWNTLWKKESADSGYYFTVAM